MQCHFINIAIIICYILLFEELLISKAFAGVSSFVNFILKIVGAPNFFWSLRKM
jgi:ABC-type Fe3+-siderophore transport system permease subunit